MKYKWLLLPLVFVITALLTSSIINHQQEKNPADVPQSRTYPTNKIQTRSLVVVNLANDKIEGQVAACALQGILNRTSEEKIYVENTLCHDNHGDWYNSDTGRAPQAQMGEFWLKEVFASIPKQALKVDSTEINPGFSALVKYAKSYIKGMIIWDPALEEATIEAATTIAGQTDGIVVSPEMAKQLDVYKFPVIENLRGKFTSNIECVDWLVQHYFAGANKQVAFTWSHMTTDPQTSWGGANKDYVVANKLFTYFLDIQKKEERDYYENIVKKYPPSTPIMGWTDELKADKLFADYGYFMVPYISVENLTVMSSFPPANGEKSMPKAYPIKNNAVYVSFFISDGDNLLHSLIYEPYTIVKSKYFNAVPTTWIINPAITDLAPPVFKWYEQKMKTNEIGAMMSDGSPVTDRFEGFSFYCDFAKHYLEKSGIRTLKQMVDAEAVAWHVQPYCINGGYAGTDWRGIGAFEYHLDNQTFHIGTTNLRDSLLSAAIEIAPKGQPLFLSVFIGGANRDAPKLIEELAVKLKARDKDHTYYFLRSMDLTATYRTWKGLPVD